MGPAGQRIDELVNHTPSTPPARWLRSLSRDNHHSTVWVISLAETTLPLVRCGEARRSRLHAEPMYSAGISASSISSANSHDRSCPAKRATRAALTMLHQGSCCGHPHKTPRGKTLATNQPARKDKDRTRGARAILICCCVVKLVQSHPDRPY
jgi:hypothetical protein